MSEREQRRALIRHLREVEGLTFEAIGQRLGISIEGARQIYLRATRRNERKPRRKPNKYQT
jgi:DNA-directed RNA polymerase specialized sigma24 family protein